MLNTAGSRKVLLRGSATELILGLEFFDEAANREISAYIAERIRGRVTDPETAEKLIPKDHGFGMQRLPLETNYFEAYNRDNVRLLDITETPIERITATDDERMPPEGEGQPLDDGEIALLKTWIDQGATWPKDAWTGICLGNDLICNCSSP